MAGNYKLKAQTIQAIQVSDPVVQATEAATLLGSSSYTIDIERYQVTFSRTDKEPLTVAAGQVIALIDGEAVVMDPIDFAELYEPA